MPLKLMRSQPAHVSLGTVLCGSFMMLAFGICSVLIGNSIGLSASNILRPTAGTGHKILCWFYTVTTMSVAFYYGGYATSKLSRFSDLYSGALHALASFSLAGLFIVAYGILLSAGFRQIVAGSGSGAVNWLILCVALFGGLSSVSGGSRGVTTTTQPKTAEELEQETEGYHIA